MAREPGKLSDLAGGAQEEWNARVQEIVLKHIKASGCEHFKAEAQADWKESQTLTWSAAPGLAKACLGGQRARELLDWRAGAGDKGRVIAQDEFLEWRVVHNSVGKVVRIEMTTELPEYWLIMAAHHPMKTLRIISRFAGERSVHRRDVYGKLNPFEPGVRPEDIKEAFQEMMFYKYLERPVKSPYNNGERAICFLSKPSNSLESLIALLASAAFPRGRSTAQGEAPLSGGELGTLVQEGGPTLLSPRNSDPAIAERINKLSFEGRPIALEDPAGVYIHDVNHARLSTPDGKDLPQEWFEFQRGARPREGLGREHSQRLLLEVPPGMGFVLGDCLDNETGEKIEYGEQIANLVQLAIYLRVGSEGQIKTSRQILTPGKQATDPNTLPQAKDLERLYHEFKPHEGSAEENLLNRPFSRLGPG